MANKQALRELQTRLAQRLQVARTEGVAASWLGVELGGGKYLFPLSHAGEIFPWSTTQFVPYTRAWYLGVANLRGGLYGVVDFASYLSGHAPAAKSDNARNESRLVALNAALEVNCALLIDRLAGLKSAKSFVDVAEPRAGAPAFFGTCLTDEAGTQWQEINLQMLCEQVQFLSIRA
jgi:twitching motility protein PilI